jgi:DNA-binding MarR family transcriptional regulator
MFNFGKWTKFQQLNGFVVASASSTYSIKNYTLLGRVLFMPQLKTINGQLQVTFSAQEIAAAQAEVAAMGKPKRGRKPGIMNETFRRLLGFLRDNGAMSQQTAKSLVEISYFSGLSTATIVRVTKELEARGILSIERNRGYGKTNRYYVNF